MEQGFKTMKQGQNQNIRRRPKYLKQLKHSMRNLNQV